MTGRRFRIMTPQELGLGTLELLYSPSVSPRPQTEISPDFLVRGGAFWRRSLCCGWGDGLR